MPAEDLVIPSFRGGINQDDAPMGLQADQVESALNVEFDEAMLGQRRLGCMTYALTSSGLADETAVVHINEFCSTNDVAAAQKWAIAATPGTSTTFAKETSGTWAEVTPDDAPTNTSPNVYAFTSQPLNALMFFAYPSAQDRLHVWDGTYLRRTGLAAPGNAPTVANTGAGTYAATIRYYRVRFVERNAGGTVVRRSEPSAEVSFTPSGTGTAARVTRPSDTSEHATHWELEASSDGDFFYLIATTIMATTTADDSTNLATTGYAAVGTESPEIGEYDLQPSAKYVLADQDRLIGLGHWTNTAQQSRVWWTPVYSDPGAGNNERLPLSTGGDNYVDLDNFEGGAITGGSLTIGGTIYIFKWGAIYRLTRTGDINHAYDVECLTKSRGALPGSIVAGTDELGRQCVYFLDPYIGPCSVGPAGLRDITGMCVTWDRVTNTASTLVQARGCFYPLRRQVKWWIAIDGNTTPNYGLVLQTNYLRPSTESPGAVAGSWAQFNGLISKITAVGMWHERTIENGIEALRYRPFIGMPVQSGILAAEMIQRTDATDLDNATAYSASIVSRPFVLAGLQNQWEVMCASLLATASSTASFKVSCKRDFGVETSTARTQTLTPSAANEPYVIRNMDDLFMAEAKTIQFVFQDV